MPLEPCSNDGVPTIIGTTIVANWLVTVLQLLSTVFTFYHTTSSWDQISHTLFAVCARDSNVDDVSHSHEEQTRLPGQISLSLKIPLLVYQVSFLIQSFVVISLLNVWTLSGSDTIDSTFNCYLQFGTLLLPILYYFTMIFFWHARLNIVYKQSHMRVSKRFNQIFTIVIMLGILGTFIGTISILIISANTTKQDAFCLFEIKVSIHS